MKETITYKYTKVDKILMAKCLKMWEWLAKTGKSKSDYLRHKSIVKSISGDCYYCQMSSNIAIKIDKKLQKKNISVRTGFSCDACPLILINPRTKRGGYGCSGSSAYEHWCGVVQLNTKKRWAGKFVEEIKKTMKFDSVVIHTKDKQ